VSAKFTDPQRQVLAKVIFATQAGRWYRAAGSGERVTLASLHRGLYLERRAWRGVEGQSDAAHEYQVTRGVLDALRLMRAERARERSRNPKNAPEEKDHVE
jgi:hypothetical protein